ncbi:MAG: hypothetical protein HGA45_25185 [Chloroflexales bacterium]|nr:hypothetical protein [Chloroflexales bacterium]
MLCAPAIYLLSIGLRMVLAAVAAVVVALVLGLLIPQIGLITARRGWLLPLGALLISLACLVVATV